ncbi:proton-coupled amino acid transporter 4-like isoform X2 [Daktulosphaira vitifoliae]|uniref:proton-coupled amino acid transporter 4-like isoform X2 n=1 Tax=Daktulosphaira vitifoliae TaxID=58002 RepID=UPI0021AA2946|nr:proton-coupled amino acid transporter 4-like isoform X2 [Daktulosphaira vitifoliae]
MKMYWTSVAEIIRPSMGLGLLCLPYAFQKLGLINAIVLCLLFGIVLQYSYGLLCRARYRMCQVNRVPYLCFHDLVEYGINLGPEYVYGFSNIFRRISVIMFFTFNLGKSCLYTKYVWIVLQNHLVDTEVEACIIYMIFCFLFVAIPTANYMPFIRRFIEFMCVFLMATYVVYILLFFKADVDEATLVNGDWVDIFQGLGVILFAYTSLPKILKAEDELKTPELFSNPKVFSVLKVSIFSITNIFIVIGTCGYLAFFKTSKLSFCLLTALPEHEFLKYFMGMYSLYIACMHQDVLQESILLFWTPPPKCKRNMADELYWLFKFHVGMICVSVLGSWLMDKCLGQMMALLGCMSIWNFMVFPYLVEFCIVHGIDGIATKKIIIFKDVLMMVLGVSIFGAGMVAAIINFSYCE